MSSQPDDGKILIRGAVDPGIGEASWAAFVPVVIDASAQRFVPADASGKPSTVAKVCKPAGVKSDPYGWFQLDAHASWWQNVRGVLVALLYGAAPELGDPRWLEFVDVEFAVGAERSPAPPPDVSQRIHEALDDLLDQEITDLVLGLVEIRNG